MSNGLQITEGGAVRRMSNVDRLLTDSSDGQVPWVPQPLTSQKFIGKNGLYIASDEDLAGFSELRVNVPGGMAGIGIPAIPGMDGSKIAGIDPITNKYMTVGIIDGSLDSRYAPSGIRVVTPPTELRYVDGERIDYTGMVIELLDASGSTFTDDTYPDGTIRWTDGQGSSGDSGRYFNPTIDTPITTAHAGGAPIGIIENYALPSVGNLLGTPMRFVDLSVGQSGAMWTRKWYWGIGSYTPYGPWWRMTESCLVKSGTVRLMYATRQTVPSDFPITGSDAELFYIAVYASTKPFSYRGHYTYGEPAYDESGKEIQPPDFNVGWLSDFNSKEYKVHGKTVHARYLANGWYALDGTTVPLTQCVKYSENGSNNLWPTQQEYLDIAYEMLYGNSVVASVVSIPVRWRSPYDGRVLEASFDIRVLED